MPSELDLAALLRPVPASAVFAEAGFNVWCGTVVRDEAGERGGRYHLYYSRWPRDLGHLAWVSHSEVAHAVSDSPLGPWRHRDVALPARGDRFWDGHCTHNPTVLKVGAQYFLYYMGNTGDGVVGPGLNWVHRNNQRVGVAVADSPDGPWRRFDRPVIDTTPGFFDALCCNNPSVVAMPEGGFLMVYKAVGDRFERPFGGPVVHVVATSDSPLGPFKKLPDPVFTVPGEKFPAEDPFIWRGMDRYWAVVKDNHGLFTGQGCSLALMESGNGIDWKLAENRLVSLLRLTREDGSVQELTALERPQVLLEDGVPAVLYCAAADRADRQGSFNVGIPLRAF